MECRIPSDRAPPCLQLGRHGADVVGDGHVQLQYLGGRGEVLSHSAGQGQAPARARQREFGPFTLRQVSDGERERVVGQHPGDQDAFPSEKSRHGLPP